MKKSGAMDMFHVLPMNTSVSLQQASFGTSMTEFITEAVGIGNEE